MRETNSEITVINTDSIEIPSFSNTLWEKRNSIYRQYDMPGVPEFTIAVMAYNRLEKTKYCVSCVLEYTSEFDYELLLFDSGSSDGTLEFFKSVEHPNKKIISLTKNINIGYNFSVITKNFSGKYLVIVSNDVYVTKNWLSNLKKCYESEPNIGLVVPVASSVSNLQCVELDYTDFEEMQEKAAGYNQSDPGKWEERIRLLTAICFFSRPVLDIVGTFDPAFIHDFIDDDLAVRLRRAGYKLILCRDTWVCHDHNITAGEDKIPEIHYQSMTDGKSTYYEKYHGIDAEDDILNFERYLLAPLDRHQFPNRDLTGLTVDGRCGTPVLEIRNKLHLRGLHVAESHAFTTQAKYYTDLLTVADDVKCDRAEFIQDYYANNQFDIVTLCEPLNTYRLPISFLQKLYDFVKPGGVLLFKLRNTDNYSTFLRIAGLGNSHDDDSPAVITIDDVYKCLCLFGGQNIRVTALDDPIPESDMMELRRLLGTVNPEYTQDTFTRMITECYLISAIKP